MYKKATLFLTILSFAFVLGACSRSIDNQTEFQRNLANDGGQSLTYTEWVDAVGKEKADTLFSGVGKDSLDLLTYGAGVSNIVQLVNTVTDADKLVTLIGNDYATPDPSGLGAIRILSLLKSVDAQMQVVLSSKMASGGAVPTDQDTIANIASLVNTIPAGNIDDKLVALINGSCSTAGYTTQATCTGAGAGTWTPAMGITREMQDVNDQSKLDRLSKLVAHIDPGASACNKVCTLVTDLTAAEVTGKLANVVQGVTDANVLVETVESVTSINNMVTVIQDVTDSDDLVTILNTVDDGTKLGYVINNVTTLATLTGIINGVSTPARLANLVNEAEDGLSWASQVNGPQNWGAYCSDATYTNESDCTSNAGTWDTANAANPHGADSAVPRLVALINGITSSQKLIDLIDGVADMTKLIRVVQDVQNVTDMVVLVEMTANADEGDGWVPMANLITVMENLSLADVAKLREVVDGQRVNGNIGTQCVDADTNNICDNTSDYLSKMDVLISKLDPAQEGGVKVVDLIEGVSTPDKIIDLVYDVTATQNLADVVNGINKASLAAPQDTAVRTLVYMVENIADSSKLVSVIDDVTTISNVPTLVNNVACISQAADGSTNNSNCTTADGTRDDLDAAGKKLTYIIDNATTIADLVFVLNNVSNITKMADLVNAIDIGNGTTTGTAKVAVLMNALTGVNSWDATNGNRGTAGRAGKLVNVIDYVTNLSDVATLINDVNDINKMANLVNSVTNSSNLVGLINAVIAGANTSTTELVTVLNGLDVDTDVPKLWVLVNNLTAVTEGATTPGTDEHNLIADLMAPVSGVAQGVGTANMISLLQELSDAAAGTCGASCTTAVTNLATVLKDVDKGSSYGAADAVNYNAAAPNVSIREAMVRLISGGVDHCSAGYTNPLAGCSSDGYSYPGIGPVHLAGAVMNNLSGTSVSTVVTMLNSDTTNMTDLVVLIGCGDHVSSPDFSTGCSDHSPSLW